MKTTITVIVAIVCVTGLALFALSKGHDGVMLSGSVIIIGGLAGYRVGKSK